MTEEQTYCPTCPSQRRRVLYDNAYVCDRCTDDLARDLERLALIAGEAVTTVAKLARTGPGGRRTGPDQPLPLNLGAGQRHDAAVNELVTRARMVSEERGVALPMVRTGLCGHTTCATRRAGRAYGPVCDREPAEHPIAVLGAWLAGQAVRWLGHHPDGPDAVRDLRAACRTLERTVDRPADHIIVGRCACETFLYARKGAKTVTCRGCGTEYDVEACRAGLQEDLNGSLLTAAELATLASYLGLRTDRDRVRKLIWAWASRGLVVAHGVVGGDPTYQCGEIMTRLMQTQSA